MDKYTKYNRTLISTNSDYQSISVFRQIVLFMNIYQYVYNYNSAKELHTYMNELILHISHVSFLISFVFQMCPYFVEYYINSCLICDNSDDSDDLTFNQFTHFSLICIVFPKTSLYYFWINHQLNLRIHNLFLTLVFSAIVQQVSTMASNFEKDCQRLVEIFNKTQSGNTDLIRQAEQELARVLYIFILYTNSLWR